MHQLSHTITETEVTSGISLTCITTDKFKTGCLTINLVCELKHETAAALALLPRVLRRGSTGLPDMQAISAALDDLYGARIEPLVRKKGEMHTTGLFADFPDDRFIPDSQNILEETTDLLCEMLLSPNMQDSCFLDDYVNSEKANLIDDIRAAINDKRGYAIDRMIEAMCAQEAYGVNRLGSESEAEAITKESLTELYHKILSEAMVKVFYCGSAKPERVATALRSALSKIGARPNAKIPKTEVRLYPADGTCRRLTERKDITQGKLTVGFRLGKAMEKPNYPALVVFNSLYGGSITSKLFLNVREKLSLCYYASSMLDKHKGLMVVASGVDFDKFETALDEIMHQLKEVKEGNISQWELTSAKRYVITSIKSALDRVGGLEELYFDSKISAYPYDPIDICEDIDKVTVEQIVDIASEIEAELIYFLTGEA
ncbi:MAG: insulinase family protein [Oscillospiraceae bacterium]|nr:insulinase family protein [Oscillospiraceae bacterium]